MRTGTGRRWLFHALLVCGSGLFAGGAHAADNSWTNTAATGFWQDGTKWSLGVPPTNSHAAILITNVATKTVTIDATTVLSNALNGCMTISNLTVRGFGAGINTLQLLVAGTVTPLRLINSLTIGTNAVLLVTNSAVQVDAVSAGELTIDGTAKLNIGSIVVTNSFTTVSSASSGGNMTVSNGTWLADGVFVGRFASSQGTLTLAGGTNTLAFLDMGRFANGTGTVWMTGGQLTVTNDNPSSPVTIVGVVGVGQMTVSNGTWMGRNVTVANSAGSQGTLTIAGGTNTVSSDFLIGRVANATGTVFVTGGQLVATNAPMVIGSNGVGQITQSGGTMLASNVTVGAGAGSQGTFTAAGGTNALIGPLTVGGLNGTGAVWVTGGQLVVTNNETEVGYSGVGQMTVSNGTWLARDVFVSFYGQGTLTVAGGTNTLASTLSVGSSANATGAVWVTGGQLTVTNGETDIGLSGVGQMTVSNGTWLARDVNLAVNAGSAGTLTIKRGTNAMTGPLSVGSPAGGVGTLRVLSPGGLIVTNTPGTVGDSLNEVIIDGSVTLANGSTIDMAVTTTIGNKGSGSLTINGGSFSGPSLQLGFFSGSRGELTMDGGTVDIDNGVVIGGLSRSTGTLTVRGGILTASHELTVGPSNGSTGVVWVTGGNLFVTNAITHTSVGDAGSGQMFISNGTVRAAQEIVGGAFGSSGTLTIAGGTNAVKSSLSVGDAASSATGTVWLTSGLLTVGGSADLRLGNVGVGQLTVSNGVAIVNTLELALGAGSRGTLTAAGGTSSVYSKLTIGNFPCTATGTVVVAGGNLFVTNATGNAVLDVRTGTVNFNSGTLVINELYVTNSCGHFNYTGAPPSIGFKMLSPAFDADGDGLPNDWEQMFGLDPLDGTVNNGASGDPDGDGLTNLQEFQLGSNPVADIKAIKKEGIDIRITWQAAASKTNALQRSPGRSGSYSNNFADIFTNTVGGVTNFLDNSAATNKPALYYRIRLVP